MERADIVGGFVAELRRGTVILCVLASLGEPTYGYSLMETLGRTGIPVEANTLYPLLRRLEGQGLLASAWDTGGAKPRKYYSLTEFGREIREELKERWQSTVQNMNQILEVAL
ncbi:MAG: PadR family transcriptional regulator [Oscillospiraceae bacterium]|nr:PadR family transcriptional regulator [Oscillospiraceae bacterium]